MQRTLIKCLKTKFYLIYKKRECERAIRSRPNRSPTRPPVAPTVRTLFGPGLKWSGQWPDLRSGGTARRGGSPRPKLRSLEAEFPATGSSRKLPEC